MKAENGNTLGSQILKYEMKMELLVKLMDVKMVRKK